MPTKGQGRLKDCVARLLQDTCVYGPWLNDYDWESCLQFVPWVEVCPRRLVKAEAAQSHRPPALHTFGVIEAKRSEERAARATSSHCASRRVLEFCDSNEKARKVCDLAGGGLLWARLCYIWKAQPVSIRVPGSFQKDKESESHRDKLHKPRLAAGGWRSDKGDRRVVVDSSCRQRTA